MSDIQRNTLYFTIIALLIPITGYVQSPDFALRFVGMGLISAIMALGVNLQWGFAGLFNVGIMGFVALGGLATVLLSMPPTQGAWGAGGGPVIGALLLGAATVVAASILFKKMKPSKIRSICVVALIIAGFFVFRSLYDPSVASIEAINPASTGYLGGLNFGGNSGRDWWWMPLIAWPVGGLMAAAVAWVIGKTALGLRSDYLAIATLGISEIIIAVMKNEDWLARGVKNINGIPRPAPYEVDLQQNGTFIEFASKLGLDPVIASTLWVKLIYAGLFLVVLVVLFIMAQRALYSPWGRMMRAIRDNEFAAEAMGKNVTARHLQVFVLGSAICGIAGAMMVSLDSQLTPGGYQPLRFTFLIWVMVIVGGSGNNLGSILGGFLIWWLWIMVEPMGSELMNAITYWMADDSILKEHLIDSVAHMKLITMGMVLLLVLRFSPRGLIPEK